MNMSLSKTTYLVGDSRSKVKATLKTESMSSHDTPEPPPDPKVTSTLMTMPNMMMQQQQALIEQQQQQQQQQALMEQQQQQQALMEQQQNMNYMMSQQLHSQQSHMMGYMPQRPAASQMHWLSPPSTSYRTQQPAMPPSMSTYYRNASMSHTHQFQPPQPKRFSYMYWVYVWTV